ncbi:ABC transporter ATP-binding protein [Natronolimnobius sp. AArcel1]|uniref:ABC transporter ATP-binding protein n=1 Tax=Natronolimnobius sp. AArcel1 TaxID=1679093 RepID=UPI0013EB6259|nr:ABC transporter ATP-binding protein [Natronolimnobius sp. AArcel1]NGM68912.1 ABC transporter ATP-binding protein [Natronolimnobius sp. AArcel1]
MKLQTESLGKDYGNGSWGIRDVTLEFEDGIHGLLGPNGAGKSTLMGILTTVLKPTTGTAYWNGTDIVESPDTVRHVLGYLPQEFGVYPDLTLEEFLEYIAALRGLDSETASARIGELLELTNLTAVRSRKLRTFSGGMRQRAGIAQALLNDPELLIVDEPTVGLDPAERVRLRNALGNAGADRMVILSTHIVPDIEATAKTVAVLDSGRVVTHSETEAIVDQMTGSVYECCVSRSELPSLRDRYQICHTVQHADGVDVRVIAETPPTDNAERVTPSLEDAYLDMISVDNGQ